MVVRSLTVIVCTDRLSGDLPNPFGRKDRIGGGVSSLVSSIPAGIDPDRQPPMAIPLRHFVVGLGFLLLGGGTGLLQLAPTAPGASRLAHVHLLLAG